MKLIIDIPKEEYEEFKKSVTFLQSIGVDFSEMRQYMLAIANGVLLEQFVNKLRKEIEDLHPHDYSSYCSAIDDVLEILDKSKVESEANNG